MIREEEYNKLLAEFSAVKAENEKLKTELSLYRERFGGISADEAKVLLTDDEDGDGNIGKHAVQADGMVTNNSSAHDKVTLFRSLFKGRDDVYARRWYSKKTGKSGYMPVCLNEWKKWLCDKKNIKCADCKNRAFAPLDDGAVYGHLQGKEPHSTDVIGVYPMTEDDCCHFLALDFDEKNWQKEIAALRDVCKQCNIPILTERSRSGLGGHVWLFFEEKIKAADARRFGTMLLNAAMSVYHRISFSAYDRMFPSQDYLPKGGLGNLIALPLQGLARKEGNSVFVDESFIPYPDQWYVLSRVEKISTKRLKLFSDELSERFRFADNERQSKEEQQSLIKPKTYISADDFPKELDVILSDMVYVEKCGISERALAEIKRMAAYLNPDFFKAQRMRLPTYDKPRFIASHEENETHIAIPRGRLGKLRDMLKQCGVQFRICDRRNTGTRTDISFNGTLREEQYRAFSALNSHDTGVLSATTAFGKTVVGARLIAEKKRNTLVLVHTSALLNQWKSALMKFLIFNYDLPERPKGRGKRREPEYIGQLGATKNTLTGKLDIAIIQSLAGREGVKDIVKSYGLVIVDECHHVPAVTFEQVLKSVTSKYVYGLTATPVRADGRQDSIFMQCGDIVYRVDAIEQAKRQLFAHIALPRFTHFRMPLSPDGGFKTLNQIFEHICLSHERNELIADDVAKAVSDGRMPIVITERTEHAKLLTDAIERRGIIAVLLIGKESAKTKREKLHAVATADSDERFAIVAVGKYVGEGFDFARLDTLFLAMPVSWKGKLAQYAGRLHRDYIGKKEVIVYDYVDINVAMLENMYHKRLKGYKELGYEIRLNEREKKRNILFNATNFKSIFYEDLSAAKDNILIVSPTLSAGCVTKLMRIYDAFICKPETKIITKTKCNDEQILRLKKSGINIEEVADLHTHCVVIDDSLVWYGSISPLGYAGENDSMLRFDDKETAALLKNIFGL